MSNAVSWRVKTDGCQAKALQISLPIAKLRLNVVSSSVSLGGDGFIPNEVHSARRISLHLKGSSAWLQDSAFHIKSACASRIQFVEFAHFLEFKCIVNAQVKSESGRTHSKPLYFRNNNASFSYDAFDDPHERICS